MQYVNDKMFLDNLYRFIFSGEAQVIGYEYESVCVELSDGDKLWYCKGQLHRSSGPAEEWANGDKRWYYKGQRHRVNGPAVEWANGTKFWYYKGQLHRGDGPAVHSVSGHKRYYKHGIVYVMTDEKGEVIWEKK